MTDYDAVLQAVMADSRYQKRLDWGEPRAMLLTLAAVTSVDPGRTEVIVSRGEAVEIGGGFRIPDVMRQSGATLVEVGTTNRTYARDYEAALSPKTAAILKVHPSNFTVEAVSLATNLKATRQPPSLAIPIYSQEPNAQ